MRKEVVKEVTRMKERVKYNNTSERDQRMEMDTGSHEYVSCSTKTKLTSDSITAERTHWRQAAGILTISLSGSKR